MQKYYQSQQNFIIHQTQDVEKTDKCSQNVKLQSNYSTTWSIEHLIHGGTLSLCHQNMASTSVLKVPPRRLEWHWVVQCSVLRKLLTMHTINAQCEKLYRFKCISKYILLCIFHLIEGLISKLLKTYQFELCKQISKPQHLDNGINLNLSIRIIHEFQFQL